MSSGIHTYENKIHSYEILKYFYHFIYRIDMNNKIPTIAPIKKPATKDSICIGILLSLL